MVEAIAHAYGDLPGVISVRLDSDRWFASNALGLIVEHDLGTACYAGWVMLSRRMLTEVDVEMLTPFIVTALDRHLRPWQFTDQPQFPTFDLFPRASRLYRKLRKWRAQ